MGKAKITYEIILKDKIISHVFKQASIKLSDENNFAFTFKGKTPKKLGNLYQSYDNNAVCVPSSCSRNPPCKGAVKFKLNEDEQVTEIISNCDCQGIYKKDFGDKYVQHKLTIEYL